MDRRASVRPLDAGMRVFAALIGTVPMGVLASVCLARFLPLGETTRFTIGFTLAIPLWVTAMCFVFLARNAQRAWGMCLGASALFAGLAYGVSP